MEEIRNWEKQREDGTNDITTTERIEGSSQAPKKGELKLKAKKPVADIDVDNIKDKKRGKRCKRADDESQECNQATKG
jgi:hypothetical protein